MQSSIDITMPQKCLHSPGISQYPGGGGVTVSHRGVSAPFQLWCPNLPLGLGYDFHGCILMPDILIFYRHRSMKDLEVKHRLTFCYKINNF